MSLTPELVFASVRAALDEDIGTGDVTTVATVPESTRAAALMRAREILVPAGLDLAEAAFRSLSAEAHVTRMAQDGSRVAAGMALLRVEGPARAQFPGLKIEVEADTLDQVEQALEARPDFILLDNMNPVQLRLAVQKCKGRTLTEASGGVSLGTVRAIAETGVDFISVGALTHSARAVDIALDFEP